MPSNELSRRRGTLRQYAVFDAVMRSGSQGAAAKWLGLSQPAVSHALAKLDTTFGTALLQRGRGGSGATEAGTMLHRRITRLRHQIMVGVAEVCGQAPESDTVRQRVAALTNTQVVGHLAIADHNSFRAAARALAISEPALQRTARELEHLVGVPLYVRRGQQIGATETGEALAMHLQLALAEIEQAHDEIEMKRGQAAGRVALGCLPLMPKALLAQSLGRLLDRFPRVEISVEEGSYDRLSVLLGRGRLDMIVGALRVDEEDTAFETRMLFDDPYVVIARSGHPLARQRRRPSAADLSRCSWVAPPHGTPRRAVLDRLFQSMPTPPRIVLETASVAMTIAALSESDCLSLSSHSQATLDFGSANLAMLNVGTIAGGRPVGVAYRTGWLPTETQRSLLDLLQVLNVGDQVSRSGTSISG